MQTPGCHNEVPAARTKYVRTLTSTSGRHHIAVLALGGRNTQPVSFLCKPPSKSRWIRAEKYWIGCVEKWFYSELQQTEHACLELSPFLDSSGDTSPNINQVHCTDIDNLENRVYEVNNDIILKLQSRDENFIQGVRQFVHRFDKLNKGNDTCSPIPQIASALHTLVTRHRNSYQNTTKKRLGKRIKVQSTAGGRRPGILRGKTQLGRPPRDRDRCDIDDFDRFRLRVRKMPKLEKWKHDLASNIAKNQQISGKWWYRSHTWLLAFGIWKIYIPPAVTSLDIFALSSTFLLMSFKYNKKFFL